MDDDTIPDDSMTETATAPELSKIQQQWNKQQTKKLHAALTAKASDHARAKSLQGLGMLAEYNSFSRETGGLDTAL